MWYFLESDAGREDLCGLQEGRDARKDYEAAVGHATRCPGCSHTLKPKPSDAMFLPSGRIHALGAGLVMLEVQQNSDTTYRIFDWGLVDAQGRPRAAAPARNRRSIITFNDFEPQFVQPHGERVVACPFFSVNRSFIYPGEYRVWTSDHTSFQYHFVAQGELRVEEHTFKRGDSWLVPASAETLPPRAARRRRGAGDGAVGKLTPVV